MSVTSAMAYWLSGWLVGLWTGIWVTRRTFVAKIRGYQSANHSGPGRTNG